MPVPKRRGEVGEFLVVRQLLVAGAGDVEDLAAQREHRLRRAVARLFRGATGRVTFDDEEFGALGGAIGAIGELAGEAEFAGRGLAGDFLVLPLAHAIFGLADRPFEQAVGVGGRSREPVVEPVAHRVFGDAEGVLRGELLFGLADEFRVADEDGEQRAGCAEHVISGDQAGLLVADHLAICAQALGQGGAHARFVGAAFGGGDGVAVGAGEAVVLRRSRWRTR